MADTGYRSPGTVVNDASFGIIPWLEPEEAEISDNVYARLPGLRLGATSQYLKATNFGFTVPTGAIIDGIKVDIERYANSADLVSDNRVRIVKAGAIQSTDRKKAGFWPTFQAYYIYGSITDLWGTSWTAAQINASNFGIVLAIIDAVGAIAYVDHFRIKVYYTMPGTNLKINIGDSWKTVEEIKINIGDVWKTVTNAQINIGDVWKNIFG